MTDENVKSKPKSKKAKAWVVIDEMYCKGCSICVRFCPEEILRLAGEVSPRGYYMPYVIEGGVCTACRRCEYFCPDFAIFIEEEDVRDDG